ncbi:MAG: glucose-6-phosphate isomerase [Treponema sp.]|jgi:glucose-6-phosphate isomerase|nr:glucose-6-phosphate isomerase [Treponema sp.]
MKYINFDQTAAYKKLAELASAGKNFDFSKMLTPERVKQSGVSLGNGLIFNWAAKAVDEKVLDALQALADEQECIAKYRALLEGDIMNTGEDRKVLHQLLRSPDGKAATGNTVNHEGRDLGDFYLKERERFYAFAEKVRSGELGPAPGKRYTAFAQIGIGGSDLGPRALSIALENWAVAEGKKTLRAEFISNVDPDDASKVVSSLPLGETLFVLVSKSGTTQETLTNELFVKEKIKKAGLDPAKHMVAVTSETSPLAHNPVYLDSFYFDDFIGGRYSSSSAVGGVILSLAYGSEVFRDFLSGADAADKAALEKDIRKNATLLDALIGVWERNFLSYPYTAILPYSQALSRFPAHLQQLDMESNGKRVNRDGKPLSYSTGPVVFGEPGTNGQHSFYQLLHQGTDIVPLQFIGFRETQRKDDSVIDGSTSQAKLKANLAAQITAFANGKSDTSGNKDFPGRRPSSLIHGERLTPKTLGALLAHYENKVMFQGFIWNVNSFDQEGVQLGKVLAKKILTKSASGSGDPVLDAYSELLGI